MLFGFQHLHYFHQELRMKLIERDLLLMEYEIYH
jgi:hypothetical protein